MLALLPELGLSNKREITIREIVELYPDFFYSTAEKMGAADVLDSVHPVRSQALDDYTQRHDRDAVLIKRSFPIDYVFPNDLPNISELLIWWIAYMKTTGDMHGLTTVRTPSSTPFKQGMLCVGFTRYEFLTLSPSYRE